MAADIHQSTISMESAAPKRPSPSRKRRKIFHTCAVSMLATAEKASLKVSMFSGPVGFLVNLFTRVITARGPFLGLYRFQTHLILAIMSFLDDWILKVENVVEDYFPSSSYFFDRIDDVICFTESLPTKLDETLDKFSGVVNKVAVRDSLRKLVDLVILLRSVLAAWWGSDFVINTKERDIMVDINCSENSHRMTRRVVCDEAVCQIEPTMTMTMTSHTTSLPEKFHNLDQPQESDRKTREDQQDDKEDAGDKIGDGNGGTKNGGDEHVPRCSYKEVLEKGNSCKVVLEKGNSFKEVDEKGSSYKEVLEKGSKEEWKEQTEEATKEQTEDATKDNNSTGDLKIVNGGNDPILELFESAWHMT